MAFLGPRIRKVYMQALNALVRDVTDYEILGIATQHTYIYERPAPSPVSCVFITLVGPFDAQVVRSGIGPGGVDQERTFTRAYLHLYRLVVAEELRPIHVAAQSAWGHTDVVSCQ